MLQANWHIIACFVAPSQPAFVPAEPNRIICQLKNRALDICRVSHSNVSIRLQSWRQNIRPEYRYLELIVIRAIVRYLSTRSINGWFGYRATRLPINS